MTKHVRIPKAQKVYCPKDKRKVPIWFCLGNITQHIETCPYLVRAEFHGLKQVKVGCKYGTSQ